MNYPTPQQIREARTESGLTQKAAAELIYKTAKAWRNWEAGIRSMDYALWELFLIKVKISNKKPELSNVRHNANFHAKSIIKKLTSRPHLEDDDGFYNMLADEAQMIKIVEHYLSQHYA